MATIKKLKQHVAAAEAGLEAHMMPSKPQLHTTHPPPSVVFKCSNKEGPAHYSKKVKSNTSITRKAVVELPGKVFGSDSKSYMEKDECRKCNFNTGVIALRPCGHGKYCRACVHKLRSVSISKGRPSRCLRRGCLSLVVGWVILRNINEIA